MLHNEPVDILAIASARLYYARSMLNQLSAMQSFPHSQECFDSAVAHCRIAEDDMAAVQTLIRELAR